MEEDFDFSTALANLKEGNHLARRGWSAENQFVFFMRGYTEGVPANKNSAKALNIEEGTIIYVNSYLAIKTVQNTIVPWLASQTDLLANDWHFFGERCSLY